MPPGSGLPKKCAVLTAKDCRRFSREPQTHLDTALINSTLRIVLGSSIPQLKGNSNSPQTGGSAVAAKIWKLLQCLWQSKALCYGTQAGIWSTQKTHIPPNRNILTNTIYTAKMCDFRGFLQALNESANRFFFGGNLILL